METETREPGMKDNKHILITEDNDLNFAYLEKALKRLSINVIRAYNGEEAVNACHIHPEIILVIMDIKMPVMDGWTAIRMIKSFRPDLPVFVVTAYMLNNEEHLSFEAGCDEYLTKPVNYKLLVRKLNKYGIG
ncbi:MAG: hypothetical protein FD166_1844 [Bacteroidetes bacterium]|nr:MAG: hypothetical protein FD166_1844 [Bacteroidota bacterium]